jgi:hypothetical protein
MDLAEHRCCRCDSSLQVAGIEEPWSCARDCGEWFTREAVEALLIPDVLRPFNKEAAEDAPRCVVCRAAMRTVFAEPFYQCAQHGVWFDKGARQCFERALEAEIARHRESRRQRSGLSDCRNEGDAAP